MEQSWFKFFFFTLSKLYIQQAFSQKAKLLWTTLLFRLDIEKIWKCERLSQTGTKRRIIPDDRLTKPGRSSLCQSRPAVIPPYFMSGK